VSFGDDRADYTAALLAEGVESYVIEGVLRDTRVLHQLAEKQCNDPAYGPDDEQRVLLLEGRIERNLAPFGISAEFQGDPRGAVVKLRLPSGRANDFGGEGYYCVPTPDA
jgi:hypothetical protein